MPLGEAMALTGQRRVQTAIRYFQTVLCRKKTDRGTCWRLEAEGGD